MVSRVVLPRAIVVPSVWVGRHGPHSIRIDANRPGLYRWMITRDGRSVASGVAADRDQAANDAAAALSELQR